MIEGWIRLHRRSLDSEIFASEKGWKIWTWILMKANFRERFIPIKIGAGQATVRVGRGQMLFGRFSAEDELGINGSTIYKWIKKMESEGMINIVSNSHYTLITICKYDEYNPLEDTEVTAGEQPSNNRVTTEEQLRNTPNKEKNIKKEKNNIFIPPSIEEIQSYCTERNNQVDSNKFFNFYQSKGWMVGKNKMKDWKAAVRTWETKEEKSAYKNFNW